MNAPLVVLVNAKGGSGATTVAVELARLLKRRGNAALIDADLAGRRTMAVMLDAVRDFDAARTVARYALIKNDGITVAELTDTLDNAFLLRSDDVDALLVACAHNDAIVADCPVPFAAAVRPLVALATRVAIVVEPNFLGIAAARALIGDLTRFGVPLDRVAIVTNLRSLRAEATGREIERALGVSILAEIPLRNDRGYARAVDTLAQRLSAIGPLPALAHLRPSMQSASADEDREIGGAPSGATAAALSRDKLKTDVHVALAKRIDVVAASRAHTDSQKLAELRAQIGEVTAQLLAERSDIASIEESAALRQEIIDEVLGYGPLEDLMRDPAVTEIMVNGPHAIYVERAGNLSLSAKRFIDEGQVRLIIERIVAPLGRRIDESSPMVDARLPDGSRVNAIIEPLALNGATLTIRRFGTRRLRMDDLVRLGAIDARCVEMLRAMVQARLNIVVSGGTGSGKTTLLSILSAFLPNTERIITIEDAAELVLKQEHVVRLESRPPNLEGRGAIAIRDLVRNALRMRPDRIVVGEVRGGEALDMLQAMNTGHDGSLTTVHANSARDAVSRLETLVLMAGFDLPVRAVREQIASAVDVIVQTSRMRDGSRKIVSISEVVGMEGDVVTMQELVRFKAHGIDADRKVVGEFQYTGVQPHFINRFEEAGVAFDIRELTKLTAAGAGW